MFKMSGNSNVFKEERDMLNSCINRLNRIKKKFNYSDDKSTWFESTPAVKNNVTGKVFYVGDSVFVEVNEFKGNCLIQEILKSSEGYHLKLKDIKNNKVTIIKISDILQIKESETD